MNKILLITVNNLKITLRKKGNIIIYLLLPLLGLIVSLALYSGSYSSRLNVGVVDNDRGGLSQDILDSLGKSGNFNIISMDENKVNSNLIDGYAACALVIPGNFTDSLMEQNPVKIEVVSVKGYETTAWIESFINLYTENITDMVQASGGEKEVFDDMYESFKKKELAVNVEMVSDKSRSRSITVQSLGFLIMFLMLSTSMTADIILKDKRNRTYFRICSAPVNSRMYIAGNVFTNVVLVFLQLLIVIFFMTKVFRVETYVKDGIMLLILMSFGLAAIGLGMLVVAFAGSSYHAGTLSTLVITPTCMLGGCFWPVDTMPEVMRKISYFMPQRWTLDAIQSVQKGGGLGGIALNLAVILAFAGAFFAVAAYKFSITDDVRRFV